jgi:methionine sulfoxide reductase heme-binding subunit
MNPSFWFAHTILADTISMLRDLLRITGIAGYVFLTFSIFCGMLRVFARRTSESLSWVTDELHQFTALIAWILVVVHLIVLLANPALPFTWFNAVQPFIEPPNRPAAPWAVIATYGMAILLVTSWLRNRIGYQTWRMLHYIGYVTFITMTVHGWIAGTDTSTPWMRAIYGGATAGVIFLTAARIFVNPMTAPAVKS